MNNLIKIPVLSTIFVLMATFSLAAQEAAAKTSWFSNMGTSELAAILFGIFAIIVVAMAMITIQRSVSQITELLHESNLRAQGYDMEVYYASKEAQAAKRPSFWENFSNRFNAAVPLDEEEDILMHHDYDGIRELDNRLPPWWVYLFYATMIFGVVLFSYRHVLGYGKTLTEQYAYQMEEAEKAKLAFLANAGNQVDETNVYTSGRRRRHC